MTDESLSAILDELIAREPLFHRRELGTTRAAFEAMTAEDFWEIGASGKRYDRELVWSVLEKRYAHRETDEWETSDWEAREFAVRPLATDVFLLTYVLRQEDRVTRRATLWDHSDGSWRVVYHQGTVVA